MAGLSFDSLSALNQLSRVTSATKLSFNKLSTGLAIPKASVNAAGLGVFKALEADALSLTQALSNVNDGISLSSVAEGGLANISDQLGRLRELTVAASSGTLSATQRDALNTESNAILAELDRVGATTAFNGQKLLDGSIASGVEVQVGANAGDTISVAVPETRRSTLGLSADDNLATQGSAQAFLGTIDNALSAVASRRAGIGAVQNRLESAGGNLRTSVENLTAAKSQIGDLDFAAEASNLAKLQILTRSGTGALNQMKNLSLTTLKLLG